MISTKWGAPANPDRQLSTIEKLVQEEAPPVALANALGSVTNVPPAVGPQAVAPVTTQDLVTQMRARRDSLRIKLAEVEAMRTELKLVEAMLALADSPKEKES